MPPAAPNFGEIHVYIRTLVMVLCFAFPILGHAQSPELKLPAFDHLRAKAIETVDINLGAWPLRFAALFMDKDDPEEAGVKEVLRNVKSLQVLSYTFDHDNEYPQAEIDSVREQLRQGGWSQLVQVRNRQEQSSVDICVILDDDGKHAKGLAVVASEAREFTIVNLVGSIDLESLGKLEGHFGVPRLNAMRAEETQ